jgi:hypothetical protein
VQHRRALLVVGFVALRAYAERERRRKREREREMRLFA